MYICVDVWMDGWIYVCMYICVYGCMDVCMDGWMYGCIYFVIMLFANDVSAIHSFHSLSHMKFQSVLLSVASAFGVT